MYNDVALLKYLLLLKYFKASIFNTMDITITSFDGVVWDYIIQSTVPVTNHYNL